MGKTVEQVAADLNISRTAWIVDEVPDVYRAFQVVHGTYDPSQSLDWTNRETQSESTVRRFGPGSGLPIKLEPNVGNAISYVPDHDHAFKGSLRIRGGGDATYFPGEKACAAFGIDLIEWSHGINVLDLSFLPDLQEALYAIDYPAGTSPGPIPSHGQPAVTDSQSGLSPSSLTPRSTVQEAADHARSVLAHHGFQQTGGGDVANALRGLLAALGM